MFKPELVEAFSQLKDKEYFWLDLTSNKLTYILNNLVSDDMVDLDIDGLMELSELFARIIDFRSPLTATHSSGVAVSAKFLAKKIGFSKKRCKMMKVAGDLHDLGKLSIQNLFLKKKKVYLILNFKSSKAMFTVPIVL